MAEPIPRHHFVRLRKRAGYSQSELARRVGCTSAHISFIEAGLRNPRPLLTTHLARVLGVDVDVLIDMFDKAPSPPERVGQRKPPKAVAS